MLDPRWIRECPDEVRAMLGRRHSPYDLNPLLECDRQRREALAEVEALKARRNEGSRKVGEARKRGEDAAPLMEEMRLLGDRIAESDRRIGELERLFGAAMLEIPNRPHESVPEGVDENDNPEIRRWGRLGSSISSPVPTGRSARAWGSWISSAAPAWRRAASRS
jgi:seryl-tRNA synthetase